MEKKGPLLPQQGRVNTVRASDASQAAGTETLATRDPEVIKSWARLRQAIPATGEASASGPGTVDVKDGGAGVRFNFPGMSRFREIDWQEWLAHIERHDLVFVYEERTPDGSLSTRYRLVRAADWEGQFR
jgi:hypothetical protein